MPPDRLGDLRVVDFGPIDQPQLAVDKPDRLSGHRVGEQLAVLIGDDGYAVGTGFVLGEQIREPVQCDLGRGDADEIFLDPDRIAQRKDRVTGVGIDERIGNGKRHALPGQLVLWRCHPHVQCGYHGVAADRCGPGLVEGAVPLPVSASRKVIDEAHVPVGIGRNPGIAATAIIVDVRDHAVIAILETRIDGVDLGCRNQRLVEKVGALVGVEKAGRGLLRGCHETQGRADRFQEIPRHLHGIVTGPVDKTLRHVRQIARVFVVTEGNDRSQSRQDQQREYCANADLEPGSSRRQRTSPYCRAPARILAGLAC